MVVLSAGKRQSLVILQYPRRCQISVVTCKYYPSVLEKSHYSILT